MRHEKLHIECVLVAACVFVFSSCSSSRWNGATFIGEGTVNGTKPTGATVETIKLETKDAKSGKRRFVSMDAANRVLGYCGLEVFNRENATEGTFELTYPDTQCDTLVNGKKITVKVTSGDITISSDEVKLLLIGNDATTGGYGEVYKFEITAKRKGWF